MTTFSVQPDPTDGLDTHLYLGNKTSTNGKTAAGIYVGKNLTAASYVYRGLIKFDLSSIPSNATVSAATLSLYYYAGTDGVANTIKLYRQLKDWSEYYACWTYYKNATAWTTEGGFDSNDCEQSEIGSTGEISDVNYGWKNISLTASKVQEWISGTLTNNGLLLKATDESTDYCVKQFYSSDYTTDTSLRPKLSVTYTTGSTGTPKHFLHYARQRGN